MNNALLVFNNNRYRMKQRLVEMQKKIEVTFDEKRGEIRKREIKMINKVKKVLKVQKKRKKK